MTVHPYRRDRQRGVVLYIALIVLVAMTLAASALIRSVETGTMVAGNLAFKQGATLAADGGSEAAIAYLTPRVRFLGATDIDDSSAGYYATFPSTLDITGNSNDPTRPRVDWDDNSCAGIANAGCIGASPPITDAAGNTVKYIIHRLCKDPGNSNAISNSCVSYGTFLSSPKRGEIKVGDDKRFGEVPTVYFRVTTRVKGPRNTVSFVETMLHFQKPS